MPDIKPQIMNEFSEMFSKNLGKVKGGESASKSEAGCEAKVF